VVKLRSEVLNALKFQRFCGGSIPLHSTKPAAAEKSTKALKISGFSFMKIESFFSLWQVFFRFSAVKTAVKRKQ